jgi:hypothetical protein
MCTPDYGYGGLWPGMEAMHYKMALGGNGQSFEIELLLELVLDSDWMGDGTYNWD